jgi:TatD DNase family protein
MFIDTHTHLQFDHFDKDREKVIQNAIQNKISALITIGTDIQSSERGIALAQNFAIIRAAVGVHPNDCAQLEDSVLNKIEILAKKEKSVAIGEIGLDYYRMYVSKEKQQFYFRKQIQLAQLLQLPIIVHNRDAHVDICRILAEEKANKVGGVLHSFTGDIEFMNFILNQNFYISFSGAITFKNANYYKLIDQVPLTQLLLETDSPFLAPIPFRGKRNEPAYIKYIAEKIAKLKKVPLVELAEITSENARNLFHLTK